MIKPENNSVIIKNKDGRFNIFKNPLIVISTSSPDDVKDSLDIVDQYVAKGLYAAGFVSYNAAVFSDNYFSDKKNDLPLIWFGIYEQYDEIETIINKNCFAEIIKWQPDTNLSDYISNISRIKSYLKDGETYQINYTFRLEGEYNSDPWDFFCEFCSSDNIPYSAYIQLANHCIASASPELFFKYEDGELLFSPMKGTRPFYKSSDSEEEIQKTLRDSVKDRAENIMIVDMIRNDVGKIAKKGTVQVPNIFSVKRYDSVFQMTSDIKASIDKFSIVKTFGALFPSASITGAPKYNSMKIISDLEKTDRNIYTGSIGYIKPAGETLFNVAIRTVLFDKKYNKASYGLGSGIVWDSDPEDEYEECFNKARCVKYPTAEFNLFETILFDSSRNSFFLLSEHLDRLKKSAEICSFIYPEVNLKTLFNKYKPDKSCKVKLILFKDGKFRIEESQLPLSTGKRKVKISLNKVYRNNFYLYHKTTKRNFYDLCKKQYPDYFDIIFMNEKREITESTIANIVIEKNGEMYTPPMKSGLLPGTFRSYLLRSKKISEKVLYPEDLKSADKIFLINSVRKWMEVSLES